MSYYSKVGVVVLLVIATTLRTNKNFGPAFSISNPSIASSAVTLFEKWAIACLHTQRQRILLVAFQLKRLCPPRVGVGGDTGKKALWNNHLILSNPRSIFTFIYPFFWEGERLELRKGKDYLHIPSQSALVLQLCRRRIWQGDNDDWGLPSAN